MVVQRISGSASYPAEQSPVLTIGNFDGVHLGHCALLARLVERAKELDAPACVYTFDPPPRAVLQPERCPPRILSLEQKLERLGQAGVQQVVVERFSLEFAAHPPEWFAHEIIGRRLRPQAMVVGYDFRFGRGRSGDAEGLARLRPGLSIEAMKPVLIDGLIASSSAIRERVAQGQVAAAAALLGRPFRVTGHVVHGDGRGRTIGFPTANLDSSAQLLPAPGVYAVEATDSLGRALPGVANLGFRPTFEGRSFTVEVHLLDFMGDLYGQQLQVDFLQRLRPEQRFAGVDALVKQIGLDVARAREVLAP